MPIKKSFLEQEWYYRVAKTFFILLPFIIIILIFFSGYVDFVNLSPYNIIYGVIGIITYFIVLSGSWRIFLYLVFGGLENDTKKDINRAGQSSDLLIQSSQAQKSASLVAGLIFFVVIIAIIIIYSNNNSSFNNLTKNTYGSFCVDSDGKEGLYGISGNCLTCSGSDFAVTNPMSNCSAGIAGVYCCK